MSDYIDRTIGDLWFVFGDHGNGCVDLNNGTDDIFTHITKEQAEKLIDIRATFLREVREVYETMPRLGCDQSSAGAGMLRARKAAHEGHPDHCALCKQRHAEIERQTCAICNGRERDHAGENHAFAAKGASAEEAYEKSNRAQAPEDQRD